MALSAVIAGIRKWDLSTVSKGINVTAKNHCKTKTENLLDLLSDDTGLGINVPRVVYFTSIGVRYFLNEKIGLYSEVGYGNSHILNIGVSYRIQS